MNGGSRADLREHSAGAHPTMSHLHRAQKINEKMTAWMSKVAVMIQMCEEEKTKHERRYQGIWLCAMFALVGSLILMIFTVLFTDDSLVSTTILIALGLHAISVVLCGWISLRKLGGKTVGYQVSIQHMSDILNVLSYEVDASTTMMQVLRERERVLPKESQEKDVSRLLERAGLLRNLTESTLRHTPEISETTWVQFSDVRKTIPNQRRMDPLEPLHDLLGTPEHQQQVGESPSNPGGGVFDVESQERTITQKSNSFTASSSRRRSSVANALAQTFRGVAVAGRMFAQTRRLTWGANGRAGQDETRSVTSYQNFLACDNVSFSQRSSSVDDDEYDIDQDNREDDYQEDEKDKDDDDDGDGYKPADRDTDSTKTTSCNVSTPSDVTGASTPPKTASTSVSATSASLPQPSSNDSRATQPPLQSTTRLYNTDSVTTSGSSVTKMGSPPTLPIVMNTGDLGMPQQSNEIIQTWRRAPDGKYDDVRKFIPTVASEPDLAVFHNDEYDSDEDSTFRKHDRVHSCEDFCRAWEEEEEEEEEE